MVVGLDIGTTKICAVIAEMIEGEAPNVIGVGITPCVGLRKGVVVDLDSTTAAIKDAVQKAERMAGEEVQSAVIGVTGEHIACLNSRSVIAVNNPDHEIQQHDLNRLLDTSKVIVLSPEREIIHAIPRWYSVDGQNGVHAPVGMHGARLEMETHIVTGLSSFIQNVVKCVHIAGLSVDGTVLEPIAAGESVLVPAEKDLGVILADIGGGTTDVAIYIDGEIYYSGVVPVGGNHVTRDIAIGLRADTKEAENIKLNHGCAFNAPGEEAAPFEVDGLGSAKPRLLPQKVLTQIIEPRMTELCMLILDHIEKAGCEGRLPAGLVFTGGGSRIKGLPELASRVTGLPSRVGKPSGLVGLVDAVGNPEYATAAGLVLFWNRYHGHVADQIENKLFAGLFKRIKEFFTGFGRN